MDQGNTLNNYSRIIERIFLAHYEPRTRRIEFEREEIIEAARDLGIPVPKNVGDVVYTFRYRGLLPASVTDCAPNDEEWVILPRGRSKYSFQAVPFASLEPSKGLAQTKVPDSTPGVIEKYRLSDEQALLARLRYNRLVDIFTGVTCYSLQNHLRTSVPDMGQIETDEVYVGVDRRGSHYIFPVQAKGGKDRQSIVQVMQDFAMCKAKFPDLVCRPIAAQFMANDVIAMFEFEQEQDRLVVACEKHYRLVPPDQVTPEDLAAYRERREAT